MACSITAASSFCRGNEPVWSKGTFSHFEARHTHPIALTRDGSRLLALNSPGSRLSVFDVSNPANPEPLLVGEIAVGLEPVSIRQRTDDEVWVINEVSDSISVVSLSAGAVVASLPAPDEPADVVFANDRAFVTCARNRQLRVFNPLTLQELSSIPLAGLMPRSMAVSPDSGTLYIAFQNSGNRTTVLPAAAAPAQPSPLNPELPPAPDTALIVSTSDPRIRYTVLDHDVAEVSTRDLQVTRYHSDVGTTLLDIALRPGTSEAWIANTDARNQIAFEPALRGHVVDNRLTRLNLVSGAPTPFDLNPALDYSLLPNPTAQSIALAQPTAIVFNSNGDWAWIASFGSDRIAKFDAANGTVAARVDVRIPDPAGGSNDSSTMRGPRGLALDESRHRLYVLNKLADSVSVLDTQSLKVLAEVPIGTSNPIPTPQRAARGFLFDARLSGNGTASCASCHIDADVDGLAWDLGDPNGQMTTVIGANLAVHDTTPQPRSMHPMKGPMLTQSLRNVGTNTLLHWRGDRRTLRDFNPTFVDLLGGTRIPDAAMDGLATYLASLRHHPNPNRTLENTVPKSLDGADPERGRFLFNIHANHCSVCHIPPTGSDNNIDDPRNFGGRQNIKTPSLQTVYQRVLLDSRPGATNLSGFGLLHDGTGGTQSLPTVHFYELDFLGPLDFPNVSAFVRCFDSGTAPAVGWTFTVSARQAQDADLHATLSIIEGQARTNTTCDLIVRGRVGGLARQFLYDPSSDLYLSSSLNFPPVSRSSLLTDLGEKDTVTFLATPPGTGGPLVYDINGNGLVDDTEPSPMLRHIRFEESWTLQWEDDNGGWVLESTSDLDTAWSPALQPSTRNGTTRSVPLPVTTASTQYFRLRRTW